VGDAETIFNTNKAKFIKVPGIGEKTINQLEFEEGLRKAEAELKNIEKNNIDVIFLYRFTVPAQVKELP
jgi:DNA processing protein